METFCYQLTQVHVENGHKIEREEQIQFIGHTWINWHQTPATYISFRVNSLQQGLYRYFNSVFLDFPGPKNAKFHGFPGQPCMQYLTAQMLLFGNKAIIRENVLKLIKKLIVHFCNGCLVGWCLIALSAQPQKCGIYYVGQENKHKIKQ